MDWNLIGTAATVVALIYAMFRNLKSDFRERISKVDGDVKALSQQMIEQNTRIDRLYQMFIDLLKEGRK